MAVNAKTRAKRAARIKTNWATNMPKFNIMDYDVSIMKMMAHFSAEVEDKAKKAMFISYCKTVALSTEGLSGLSDGYFSQLGPLSWMLQNNIALEQKHKIFMRDRYNQLMNLAKVKTDAEAAAPEKVVVKPNPQLAIRAKADTIGSEIDAIIDQVVSKKVDFDPKDYLIKNQVSAPVAKLLEGFYKPMLKELEAATGDNDYQLSEGYMNIGKRDMNRYLGFMRELVNACGVVALMAKTTRKPRTRKEKPAVVIVQKVKYLKEYPDLNLKSTTPDKMVGASEVWVFNVKYRKLFQYVAQDGMTLTVKGTTLQNFDPSKSGAKTIRKPEVFFKGIDSMTKRPLVKQFNEVRGVLAKATGRINEDTLIVKVF